MRLITIILKCFFAVMITSTLQARELECRYDYITFTTIRYLKEDQPGGNIVYKYRNVDSGNDTYKYTGSSEFRFDTLPLINMYDNMYYSKNNDWLNSVYYIDFQRAQMHEFQAPDTYISELKIDPKKLTDGSTLITVPIQIWDCKRTD